MQVKLISLALALLRVVVADDLALAERQFPVASSSSSSVHVHLPFQTVGTDSSSASTSASVTLISGTASSTTVYNLSATTTEPATLILTGQFTAGAGIFGVTSQSGYAYVAGHELSVGGDGYLVGGVQVTEASNGFYANGSPIQLFTYTPSSTSNTMATTTAASAAGGSDTTAASSSAASTSSPHSGAKATAAPVIGGAAAMMLLGVMAL